MADPPAQGNPNVSKPVKRMRWATQRVASVKARNKRQSMLARFRKANEKRESGGHDSANGQHHEDAREGEDGSGDASRRTIYFNIPLPDEAKDQDGHPLAHYSRNKIRTSKYTPLSFVPKNLWHQFHNIANVYFLILIILAVRGRPSA
jgi:phospholipid-translocating ATPase